MPETKIFIGQGFKQPPGEKAESSKLRARRVETRIVAVEFFSVFARALIQDMLGKMCNVPAEVPTAIFRVH